MVDYSFPNDLYVNVKKVKGQAVKAEVYRRVESKEGELLHMKRVGLIWLGGENTLENLIKRLKDESSWSCHG